MIDKSIKNAVVHHMHTISALAALDPESFGIYSERMRMTLQLCALMKEAFDKHLDSREFDKRAAIILGSDVDAVAKLKEDFESFRAGAETLVNNYGEQLRDEQAAKLRADSISQELRNILKQTEEKVTRYEAEISELHKLMAAQRESINALQKEVTNAQEYGTRLRAENEALKNATTPKE
jgi:predicted RNase H-like nuclease (RuvC/YqgF family)